MEYQTLVITEQGVDFTVEVEFTYEKQQVVNVHTAPSDWDLQELLTVEDVVVYDPLGNDVTDKVHFDDKEIIRAITLSREDYINDMENFSYNSFEEWSSDDKLLQGFNI